MSFSYIDLRVIKEILYSLSQQKMHLKRRNKLSVKLLTEANLTFSMCGFTNALKSACLVHEI